MTLSLAWLRKLGPFWTSSNGPSNIASRHRPGKRARSGLTIAKQSVGPRVKTIAQGWAGENGDRRAVSCSPRKSQEATNHLHAEGKAKSFERSF